MTLDHSVSSDLSADITSIASWDFSSEPTTPGSNGSRRSTQPKTRTLAPNLTRRSHKKSRGGCFSCKQRKIKCSETKPACGSCLMKGLSCVYPTEPAVRKSSNLPLIRRNPSTSPSFPAATFSILDMRFFHHFLTIAYPHLPVDNDHVWINDIPQFAEQHEYLMHALLSLGASHLSRLTGVDYRRESLIHRGQAIAGLNQALSQTARSYGEADAMLASCYALTFQASYMSDGLSDFITMVRGCALTTEKIKEEHSPTAFNLQPDWHFKYMAPRLQNLPPVDPRLLQDAYTALESIRPFLTGGTEIDFHAALVDVITSLQASPASGYIQFIGVYGVWYELCHDSFKTFLDPNNLVAQLLLAYFVGVQLLMVPLAAHEWPHRADVSRVRVLQGTVEWAQGIFQRLEDSEWEAHLDWPKNVIATVLAEINGDVLQLPPVLQLHLTTRDITPQSTILTPT
ncbi:uncharacterized protein PV07_11656 [Cladophialophora immunda]|uniref:Zn(2)-C6 fungal-type domain-containing protein n=1 Tax=Cladophialophora immunda TaxID=569365 RepID=A0A0D2AEY7_9EURO|nr:uncharacterized protein PV07_11656 [Cladophialophora immunda]KIW23462.1 hypothetical protein PV07_11656 [Cladophialophora immunda]OQV01759.1 Fungal specific transcription factor domain-containing protein [Cladophialophora immunda]